MQPTVGYWGTRRVVWGQLDYRTEVKVLVVLPLTCPNTPGGSKSSEKLSPVEVLGELFW
jgi:hypothetical protein